MYKVFDVSANTSDRLYGKRNIQPVGAMLHNSDGWGVVKYLQGGVLQDGRLASADYAIVPNGEIYCMMPRGKYAFHAGDCSIDGKVVPAHIVNQEYIGIEIETGKGGLVKPTEAQYRACAGLLLSEAMFYEWSPLRVLGHGTSAYPMGRRNDPRNWDWGYLFWLMAHEPLASALIGDWRNR